MPPPRVRFAKPVVTSVSRPLHESEEKVVNDLGDHLFYCRRCKALNSFSCRNGRSLVRKVKAYIQSAKDGRFYSTRTEYDTPVRLEIPDRMKHSLRMAFRPDTPRDSRMTVFYRRVEQHRFYSILAIEKIVLDS